MKKYLISVIISISILPLASPQSVVNSLHNLSASGPGSIKAVSENEVCIFCHTPHNSKPSSPLWNRNDPGVVYDLYTSTTIESVPGQPDGSSILCLSCHDGTIALGNVLSRASEINFTGGITMMPPGNTNQSIDLSDDHPVSFEYNSSLSVSDKQIKDPALISYPVTLEEGKVQCTSCHDPHKNIYTDFLVKTSQYSDLCFECHDRDYWSASSHKSSTATVQNILVSNPWTHTPYGTVAENACENCHNPHSAEGKVRLLNYLAEESNCLVCHNGNVASTDIASQLSKPKRHDVVLYHLDHDAGEENLVATKHVECEDCHNPHAVNNSTALAPYASGFLSGVKGIDQDNNPVNPIQNEYELCYRCHTNTSEMPASFTTRWIQQNNVRLEFDLLNPSYHPVVGAGKNTDCPSLISPYTVSSIIYCTDCHSSDEDGSPAGPHGSANHHILKYNYETADYTTESATAYELCYSCHSQASILGNNSFGSHYNHIVVYKAPCSTCHDPHGISSTQGNENNNTHLINFDMNIVSQSGAQTTRFEDDGTFHGTCFLKCHGQGHGASRSY